MYGYLWFLFLGMGLASLWEFPGGWQPHSFFALSVASIWAVGTVLKK